MADSKLILQIATSQAVGLGLMLQGLDTNKTGKDDVMGNILVSAGSAATGYQQNNDGKFNAALRAIRDVCDAHLSQQSG